MYEERKRKEAREKRIKVDLFYQTLRDKLGQ